MNRGFLPVVLVAVVCVSSSAVFGQRLAPANGPRLSRPVIQHPAPAALHQPQPPSRPSEPYMLRPGVYVIPAPYSPDYWSPTIRSYSSLGYPRSQFASRARSFRPRSHGNWGCWNPYPPAYGWAPYGADPYSAYEQGRYDAEHDYVWYIASQRAGQLLNQWSEQFDQAIILFRDGNYEQAAINLLGAAEKNHADGASRLHAGHALFAIGRYTEAVFLIERAFELAPSLAYKSYDIRDEYGDKSQFDQHLAALQLYVVKHPDDAAAVTLLGYVTYYSEGPSAAYPYLKRAANLNPNSYFIPKLLTPSQMVSPPDRGAAAPPKAEPRSKKTKESKTLPRSAKPKPPDAGAGRAIAIAN